MGGRPRVLVVEDDPGQRRTLTDLLLEEGLEPLACGSVPEARDRLAAGPFAVAVVDQRLPGMEGLAFLQHLRSTGQSLRVIINTGFGSFDTAKDSVNLGAFAYVEKAGDPEELLRHVHRAVREHAEEALARSEERYRQLYDNAPDLYLTLATGGRVSSVNRFGAAYLGYAREELLANPVWPLVHVEDREAVREQLAEVLGSGAREGELEFRALHRDRRVIRVQARLLVGRDTIAGALEIHLLCRDITEAHDRSTELSYHATHDALTGLVNRRELEIRLARVLETAREDGSEHALCYVDLDQFKIINDTCGHAAGDELLRQLGRLLPTRVRKRDTVARIGGDEFAALMEHCTLTQARRAAEALRLALEKLRFSWEERSFGIAASIGVVSITAESRGVSDVLGAADAACYLAKELGRNRIHVHREDDVEQARRRGEVKWVARIGHALEEGRFRLAFQPILPVSRAAGGEEGLWVELLLRMSDDHGRLILPGAFLPAAGRHRLSGRLDRWVLHRVCDWLIEHAGQIDGLGMLAVNVSGNALADEEYLAEIIRRFGDQMVCARRLCFELTEAAALANLGGATRFIAALRPYGCRFALDDFGRGLSSFAHLRQLPVDFLKIDGVFTRGLDEDPLHQAVVRSVCDIARALGQRTIAESVENASTLERLRAIGVDYAQGYGVARPRSLDRLPALLLAGAGPAGGAAGQAEPHPT